MNSAVGGRIIRVVVADDHPAERGYVRQLLNGEVDLEVIGTARDGAEAWRVALELAPDVLVLDQNMPDAGGLEVAGRLRRDAPNIRILLFTLDAEAAT